VPESLSSHQARRIALAAQGFGRPQTETGTRQLNLLLERLAVLQLDSVNVFERSHYLPAFARLGAYDKAGLDRLTLTPGRGYVEYWAHQASVIPVRHRPLWEWSMEEWRGLNKDYGRWGAEHPDMLNFLRAELREKGPLTAGQVEHDSNRRTGAWWGWSDVKTGLETLFMWGEVVPAGRRRFERTYDLAERQVPAELLGRGIPKADAIRELVRLASRALGVGTVGDIADYFRLLQAPVKAAINELVDAAELTPVTVHGWGKPAFLHTQARIPRRIEAAALLSPFDPIVWHRERTERIFGFSYRIEIYTPEPQRVFGYYTLPLLIDEQLVGRIDLKTDRQAGVLRVQSAWREPGAQIDTERLGVLLRKIADWQAMEHIEVVRRGDLASILAAALRSRAR
jgi:uncharacterized protein YcaQ